MDYDSRENDFYRRKAILFSFPEFIIYNQIGRSRSFTKMRLKYIDDYVYSYHGSLIVRSSCEIFVVRREDHFSHSIIVLF